MLLHVAAGGFIFGQLLFISPLYYQAVKGRDASLKFVMPIGGACMMLAWLSLIFA
jgi:uncharacterized membrane protein YgdD (TMEM256/DUF423 family)